ncbi:MAG: AMP-binding protein [Proteobacteria bacterium]|nr:AMP-binding protein [Pseudomonadota bacterium]
MTETPTLEEMAELAAQFGDPLSLMAALQGDKLAVTEDRPDGTIIQFTFSELEQRSNQLGRGLMELGVKPGTKVVWCGPNSPWIVVCIQACRKIGATAVPMNYRLAAEEIAYIVDNSDAQYVIADGEYAQTFADIRKDTPQVKEIIIFDGTPSADQRHIDDIVAGRDTSAIKLELDPEAVPVSMIYTSGTTGRPKGAVRKNSGDPTLMMQMIELIGYTNDDIYITTGPLYHSGPGSFMGIGLMLGQSVVIQRKFNAEDWLRLVDKYKVTSTFSAPTPIRRVCQLDEEIRAKYDVSSMHVLIANAAPWSFALKKLYVSIFPEESLFEVYGSTELGVNCILTPPYQMTKPGSCGKPAPGVEIFLFDDDGNLVTEPHVQGELFVRSVSMFSEYHKAKDQYEKDRKGDMQTVGDVAYFDEEGFYYICDRKKDMIISGGMNIYPAEIEDALEHHENIMDVAVFGIPSEEWGETVHAIITARPGSSLTEGDVAAFSREHLASYKVPRSIEFMDEIPRNGSGKILKKDLRAPYWKEYNSQVG